MVSQVPNFKPLQQIFLTQATTLQASEQALKIWKPRAHVKEKEIAGM